MWGNSFNSIHKCNILKLGQLSNKCISIFIYKNFDPYVHNPSHSCAIRNIHNLRSIYCRLNLTQRSFSYIGPKTWNDIPEVIGNFADQREFEFQLN